MLQRIVFLCLLLLPVVGCEHLPPMPRIGEPLLIVKEEPPSVQVQPLAAPLVNPVVFPTSVSPAQGKAWESIGEYPFTGSLGDGCRLLGLSPLQCDNFRSMVDRGECRTMRVPDGTVLNDLLFSVNGEHRARRYVGVSLKWKGSLHTPITPEDRTALVCDIGKGVYVGRFTVCNNPFRVDTTRLGGEVLK